MNAIISDALIPFIDQGKLSVVKIHKMIELKEFVDRIASRSYIGESTVENLKSKFGVAPEVITWGDYLQGELAFDAVKYSDEEFSRVVDTIRFDMMSAYKIFSGHGVDFFEWVESSSCEIIGQDRANWSEEEEEIIHLKILKDYFLNLGITDNFSPEELLWYESFESNISSQQVS